jgi:hypothetical protein
MSLIRSAADASPPAPCAAPPWALARAPSGRKSPTKRDQDARALELCSRARALRALSHDRRRRSGAPRAAVGRRERRPRGRRSARAHRRRGVGAPRARAPRRQLYGLCPGVWAWAALLRRCGPAVPPCRRAAASRACSAAGRRHTSRHALLAGAADTEWRQLSGPRPQGPGSAPPRRFRSCRGLLNSRTHAREARAPAHPTPARRGLRPGEAGPGASVGGPRGSART